MQFKSLTNAIRGFSLPKYTFTSIKNPNKINQIAFFSAKKYDQEYFNRCNSQLAKEDQVKIEYHMEELSSKTAKFASGYGTVCAFVNDKLDASCLKELNGVGVDVVALRCAGFNNVDLKVAKQLGMKVVRVPAYSPYAVAEHAMALFLAVNRKIPRAYNRTKDGNFALDGLTGFDFHGKTVGIIGAGKIGRVFAEICKGFGLRIIYYDVVENQEMNEIGGKFVSLKQLWEESKLISLHCPLTPDTKHIIRKETLSQMKQNPIIVNTGRGALINSVDVIEAVKEKQISGLGLDVYEQEEGLFFADHSVEIMSDDVLSRLLTLPNVIITGHQAFFTDEALSNISSTTLNNIIELRKKGKCTNEVVV